jgi:beta-lactamase superfamily II metal-dependent hydrolase
MPDEPFKLGNAEIVMYYWPDGQDPNTLSGTLYITFGDATIMIPSDLTGSGQKYLLETYGDKLKCDILKVPHHGLGRLVTEFLPAVQPQLAIYTNYTKSTAVCDRQMKKYDIPFMHTSAGTIFVETDGTDWYVEQVPHLLDKKAPIPKK